MGSRVKYDVVVIGGGQAGLAMGHHLARKGRDFVILDAAPRIGHAWRTRWDSLRLFTPARYSGLPGMPFPGDPDHLPYKDEVADYLESYARRFELPVRGDEAVTRVRCVDARTFEVETANARYEAGQVVIATGPFQMPFVPALAAKLGPDVVQLHSSAYRNPAQLPPGDVLVVGAGNSGVQIAAELARHHRTWLSVGEKLPRLPERLFGRSIFHWLYALGAMDITIDSRLGRRAAAREVLIGESPRSIARAHGVRIVGRATRATANRIETGDGQVIEPAAVIWATGFRMDFGFVDAPIFDSRGMPRHTRGITTTRGLYFLGLPWMHTRDSALIGGVGRDAEHIAAHMTRS